MSIRICLDQYKLRDICELLILAALFLIKLTNCSPLKTDVWRESEAEVSSCEYSTVLPSHKISFWCICCVKHGLTRFAQKRLYSYLNVAICEICN